LRMKPPPDSLKTWPPESTTRKEGSTRNDRRSTSNCSITPSQSRSSLLDPKKPRPKEAVENEGSKSGSGRSRSGKSTCRSLSRSSAYESKSVGIKTSNINDLVSQIKEAEERPLNLTEHDRGNSAEIEVYRKAATTEIPTITHDSDPKKSQHLRGSTVKSDIQKPYVEMDTFQNQTGKPNSSKVLAK
jgi:hypothetical protein